MSESMNISYEHEGVADANNNDGTVLVKQEPNLETTPSYKAAERAVTSSSTLHKKSQNDSDFEPVEASDEDDFSIPESENASWDSCPKSGKRRGAGVAKSSRKRSAANRRMAAHYADLKRQAESDDEEFFADMPRQRLSRRCKTAASKRAFHEFDEIPSSSSPEEFDERIHVRTKAEKLRLEMESAVGKRVAENAASDPVKKEPVEKYEPTVIKAETTDTKPDEQSATVEREVDEANLDVSMNTEGSGGEHMQEEKVQKM